MGDPHARQVYRSRPGRLARQTFARARAADDAATCLRNASRGTAPYTAERGALIHVSARPRDKNLHPHSICRTAIALLKGGVDFATISQWRGHAGLTRRCATPRADLDLKAISQMFPDALAPPRARRLLMGGSDMVG